MLRLSTLMPLPMAETVLALHMLCNIAAHDIMTMLSNMPVYLQGTLVTIRLHMPVYSRICKEVVSMIRRASWARIGHEYCASAGSAWHRACRWLRLHASAVVEYATPNEYTVAETCVCIYNYSLRMLKCYICRKHGDTDRLPAHRHEYGMRYNGNSLHVNSTTSVPIRRYRLLSGIYVACRMRILAVLHAAASMDVDHHRARATTRPRSAARM